MPWPSSGRPFRCSRRTQCRRGVPIISAALHTPAALSLLAAPVCTSARTGRLRKVPSASARHSQDYGDLQHLSTAHGSFQLDERGRKTEALRSRLAQADRLPAPGRRRLGMGHVLPGRQARRNGLRRRYRGRVERRSLRLGSARVRGRPSRVDPGGVARVPPRVTSARKSWISALVRLVTVRGRGRAEPALACPGGLRARKGGPCTLSSGDGCRESRPVNDGHAFYLPAACRERSLGLVWLRCARSRLVSCCSRRWGRRGRRLTFRSR